MNTAFIIVDLLYGDSGKGTTVDSFARKYQSDLVIRYNGGAQAAHNVIDENGLHHLFAQFGSGTLIPKVRTFLSEYMMVNPLNLIREEKALKDKGINDAFSRLYIDERALVTTPYHIAVNKLLEVHRGNNRHGSCGMGIGETMFDSLCRPNSILRMGDLRDKKIFQAKLEELKEAMLKRIETLNITEDDFASGYGEAFKTSVSTMIMRYDEVINKTQILDKWKVSTLLNYSLNPIFEGAQGICIDETYGFHPYTTWSNTTSQNAIRILENNGWRGDTKTVGVLRTFATRHGAGPFVTECKHLSTLISEAHNTNNEWQKAFRAGWLDLPLLEYASQVNHLDYLALTHLDVLEKLSDWPVCINYVSPDNMIWKPQFYANTSLNQQEELGKMMLESKPSLVEVNKDRIASVIEQCLETPIILSSHGPASNTKTWNDIISGNKTVK